MDKRREDIRIAHCWAHARRDFADAVKLLKKGGPSKQRIKKTIAYQALERIGTMYALEDEWKGLTLSERLSRRQEHMKPLVEAYFAWVKGIDLDTVLSEKTKGGLQYSINQEKYLRTFWNTAKCQSTIPQVNDPYARSALGDPTGMSLTQLRGRRPAPLFTVSLRRQKPII